MFRAVMNLHGGAEVAPPKDVVYFEADAELKSGTVVIVDNADDSKVKAAGDTTSDAMGILVNDVEAGDDARIAYILPGQIFKAPIDGNVENDFGPGFVGAQLSDDGKKVDGNGTNDAGPLTVLYVDDDEDYAWVVFNECALAQ